MCSRNENDVEIASPMNRHLRYGVQLDLVNIAGIGVPEEMSVEISMSILQRLSHDSCGFAARGILSIGTSVICMAGT